MNFIFVVKYLPKCATKLRQLQSIYTFAEVLNTAVRRVERVIDPHIITQAKDGKMRLILYKLLYYSKIIAVI